MSSPGDKRLPPRPIEEETSSGTTEQSSMDSWLALPPPVEQRAEFLETHYDDEIRHSYRKVERWLNSARNAAWFETPYFDEEDRRRHREQMPQVYDSNRNAYESMDPPQTAPIDLTRRSEQFTNVREDRSFRRSYTSQWDITDIMQRTEHVPVIESSPFIESSSQRRLEPDEQIPGCSWQNTERLDHNYQPLAASSRVGGIFEQTRYVEQALSINSSVIQVGPGLEQHQLTEYQDAQPIIVNSNVTLHPLQNVNYIPSPQWPQNEAGQSRPNEYADQANIIYLSPMPTYQLQHIEIGTNEHVNPADIICLSQIPTYQLQHTEIRSNEHAEPANIVYLSAMQTYQLQQIEIWHFQNVQQAIWINSNAMPLYQFLPYVEQRYENRQYDQQATYFIANALRSFEVRLNQAEQNEIGPYEDIQQTFNTDPQELNSSNFTPNSTEQTLIRQHEEYNISLQHTTVTDVTPNNAEEQDQSRQYGQQATYFIANALRSFEARLYHVEQNQFGPYEDIQQTFNTDPQEPNSSNFTPNNGEQAQVRQYQEAYNINLQNTTALVVPPNNAEQDQSRPLTISSDEEE